MNYKFDNNIEKSASFIDKYKPTTLEETFYNEHFKDVIYSLIEMNDLNILLKGDVCSGKTTLTDCIINKYYTGINKKDIHDDIYVFTCLNEQGINGFRRILKEFCQTKGNQQNKKKTIILDDIDTLTDLNQQIIRSNIDKYSGSINFIASCTNLNKVIDTLQSRFNILKIPTITKNELLYVYNNICKRENITLTKCSKDFVIKMCDHSTNVLVNNLEKLSLFSDDVIELDDVKHICCQVSYNYYTEYIDYIKLGDKMKAFEIFNELYETGYSFIDILENFIGFIKHSDTINDTNKFSILKLICKYINILYTISNEYLEMLFFTNEIKEVFM